MEEMRYLATRLPSLWELSMGEEGFPQGREILLLLKTSSCMKYTHSRKVNKVIIPEMCRCDNSGLIAVGVHTHSVINDVTSW